MRVTPEQIERANLVNLPDFLRSQGFSLKQVGREYILQEHDSLHIKNNEAGEVGKWFRFSENKGGSNIQFVQKFMGLDFISAVELLSNEKAIPFHSHSISKAEPPKNREIMVHDSKEISRITDYLHNICGLSYDAIAGLIADGRLSQEEKTGNAVFKIFDESGLLVGAEKVGTSNVRFKSFDKGAADGYGFEIVSGKPKSTYFFESAIDAISFAALHSEQSDYRLVSMAGVKPSVVTETMKRYAISPENIYLCTDNDKAGNEFAEKLIARYPAMKRVTPNGAKDWNDILQGRMNKMKRYGNPYWQEATDNRDKTVAVMREDTFQQIQQAPDKSGLNYCAYSDGSNTMIAVNSSEIGHFKNVTGLDESLCRLQKSGKEHIPQDKNIIGNTDYKYIPRKSYISEDRETILKMAELANKANISFSARIYPSGKAVMTVSQADISQINAIQDAVKAMRKPMIQNSRQASQEIIGNRPYREIRNRQFMISPLTHDKYHKIEPKLYERGAEFSGLIRDGKVMFTTEKENAPHFQAILRQTICENQILENLQNIGLDNQQIQALSSSIGIAARNNMANVIENYVSKDYDITQLGTMNDLLIGYLDQSDTSQFLDNSRQLDLLLSAKQEFDLQIAQREELLSDDEINLPEPDSVSFRFGDQSKEWFTESDLLADFVQDNPEMSFALANAVLGYLDEKQHTERNVAGLNAGWYKKTDFTVTTMIDGQEFRHSGRFDIGDGAGTGGGTLIDHIEQFAKNALKQEFLYNENDRESLNYLLDHVVPFLTENAALTAEEQRILDNFKEQHPIRTAADVEIVEPVQNEPTAIADSMIKVEDDLTEKVQSREPTDLNIAKQHIAEYLDREFGESPEFSDMAKIALAYTTDEEHDLPVLVYADLEQYRLVFEYDGNVVRDEKYSSLAEMNENALSVLDFDDLVSLSDDEIVSVIPTKASDLPFKVGDNIEFQGKEWHIDSINEDRGRIMLSRDTGNVIMPQEGLETFLSEVVESANHHAGIENLEQSDTEKMHESIVDTDTLDTADKSIANEKEPEQKSGLLTFDVYIYDRESGTNSPMRCQAKNTAEAKKIADEYINRWNLVDAEITDVQFVAPKKELVKDEPITGKSAENEIFDDAPLFSESTIADAGLGFVADDKEFKPFGNGKQEYEQLTLFGESEPVSPSAPAQTVSPVQYGEPIADVDRFQELHKEIMRGSGFENGKFRIEAFFQENHPSTQEFADFLKNEYGTGGHTADGNIFSVAHDSKGIQFTLRSIDNGISKETFDFSWTEVAKLTADLIKHDKYITQDDIDRRNQRGFKTEKSDIKPENISAPDEKSEQQIKADEKTQNFTITDDNLGEGGAKTKFKNNLLAIQTLKQIESEDRTATPEEQEILSKYVGWGGLAQAFDSENEQWSKEFAQLSNALSPKEYEDARKSVLDSFFTSPAIIDGIYEALDKFGFNGGNLLEPSCGVGNFLGKMPSEMAEHTNIYGVEIDSISGRIAKQLYPDADIQITGFENTNFQNGSFDVAVGNVPFGDLNFPDKQYGTTKLHDFFFAQTLDKVKEGGIVAFVTSKGTLDKKDESFRMQLAEKADLIGAVRLPNNAFKANAGTEVTSDILFLQKRSASPEELPDWVHLGKTEDGLRVNSYFAENPEMVLGTIVEGNKLYGRNDDTMCIPIEGADLRQQIHEAVQKLNAQISQVKTNAVFQFSDKQVTMTAAELRPFSFFKDDKGDIYLKGGESKLGNFDVSKVMDTKSKDYDRMTAFIDLRDTVRELLKVQADDRLENEIKAVQQKLSVQYDDFYKKYGLFHSRKNRQVLRDDCSYNLLLTLEKEFDKDKLIAKSDIFTKRTVRPSKPIEHVDTALEALTISMAETAKVDLAYMSKLTDMSEKMLISELKGEIFLVPDTNTYQSASEYLSGDIRQKLDIAENYAEKDSRFAENVAALQAAMPEPLKAGDIDVKIGAAWIPKELYQQFMYETFQTPRENREDVKKAFWIKPKNITVDYSEHTNTWHIENKRADASVISTRDYGSRKMNAYEIMEQLLNLKEPKVYKPETYIDLNGNEKERRVVDIKATKIVQQKAGKIKQAFKDWIFKDTERAIPLVEQYNRQFNSIRPREYDGSALRFPGMNSAITLKEHQKNAIAHALFGGNTLFAHCVGAGKTFEMIATAMESKRLGLCTKPLFAVPNHLTEQIGEDFQKLYPGANILVATKNDFKKENRQQLFAKIATGDFDAVIIGHSQLGMIPLSKERQVSILQDQIDDIMAGIEELKKAEGSRFQVKQMERTKKSLEARLDKLEKTHDDILTFEEMGIDKLIIDESHEFKNVPTQTKLTNVAGISSSASQKALDLFMKCRYLDEKTGSRGVIMATGTPLSNSVTELHTMMRFLEYDFLKDHGLSNFDNWVTVFGEQKTEWELAPAGNKFKERTRIANYTGLPELMSMFKQVADVRTADTLDLATPEMKYHIENIEATEFQKTLVQELSDRADDVQSGNIDPSVDNMLRITSDGRKLGLDPRLIDPSFEDHPDTKLNQCVRNVMQIYHDTADEKLTQIIFCDLGVPKKNSQSTDKGESTDERSASERESLEEECDFCVYDDIRDKLIQNGIKPEEIAYVHDAKTEQQKADLFDRVNKGEVRVLLGSTGKMGTGTNCQKKLIALHNLDIPWRPSDLQQRIGRIERQGNQNSVAHVFKETLNKSTVEKANR
ncbi:MAG: toprim domain-containing protein [Ruminococcus callidus]|uniref:toprim domain-containing protein n=1 Tax=Ruminococcus callidus TaxID=40519 RepID=UPI002E7A3858|nr:toprim domain-containing protein [Ruminococcus callidus]MEE0505061.1 toprim domain-containing protein [Ruminococcus callidus]